MNKSEIELVLGVRSDERVVVVSNHSSASYPDHWLRPETLEELRLSIDCSKVVIIDSTDVSKRTLAMICGLSPRMLAVVPLDEEHARSIRRALTSLYPWAEFWSISSALGRLVVTKDAAGRPYDRESVIDMRPSGAVA